MQIKDIYRNFAIKLKNISNLEFEEKDIKLAKYLKALSHPVRLSILKTLMDNCRCPHGSHPCNCGEACEGRNCKCGCKCGTIVENFNLSQSTISQHIKELKSVGLIELKSRKGDYTINHVKLKETWEMLQNIFELPGDNLQENKECKCCG